MARALLLLALAAAAAADDALVTRWDSPKRESFDMKAATVELVTSELTRLYGARIRLVGSVEPKDFVAKDVTFFEALDRLALLHGLTVVGAPGDEEHPLRLIRPGDEVRTIPAACFGGSRLSVVGVSVVAVTRCAPGTDAAEDFDLLDDLRLQNTPSVAVRFRWIVEPGLEGLALLSGYVANAKNEREEQLEQLAGFGDEPVPANRDFILRLDGSYRRSRVLRKLEGTVQVVIPLERGKVEFQADEIGKAKPLGGAGVTLDHVDRETKTVKLTVLGAPCAEAQDTDLRVGSAEEADDGWKEGAFRLLAYDATGLEIPRGRTRSVSHEPGKWTCKVEFESVPTRIALEGLVSAVVREAPFSFSDIPLPE